MKKIGCTFFLTLSVSLGLGITNVACRADSRETVRIVLSALDVYFKQEARYPETLEALADMGLVPENSLKPFQYVPLDDFGNYRLMYQDQEGRVHFGPSYEGRTQSSKLNELKNALYAYYNANGRYPTSLEEFTQGISRAAADSIEKMQISYWVSEDLQEFGLDGIKYSDPPYPGDEYESRETKVFILATMLNSYYVMNGRYPESLEKLKDSGIPDSHYLDQLLEGENINYSTAADGKDAFLDNRNINSIYVQHP
jgi:hypothetical protein